MPYSVGSYSNRRAHNLTPVLCTPLRYGSLRHVNQFVWWLLVDAAHPNDTLDVGSGAYAQSAYSSDVYIEQGNEFVSVVSGKLFRCRSSYATADIG